MDRMGLRLAKKHEVRGFAPALLLRPVSTTAPDEAVALDRRIVSEWTLCFH